MASTLLTDIAVRSLKPITGRQVDVYDSKIKGLAVRVSPMGTKSFVVWYRIGSKARRLTLGRFPTMSLAEARKRALSNGTEVLTRIGVEELTTL